MNIAMSFLFRVFLVMVVTLGLAAENSKADPMPKKPAQNITATPTQTANAIIANHKAVNSFQDIPLAYFEEVRSRFRIFYGRTSHGSQITSGLRMIEERHATLFQKPRFHEAGGDLGHNGDTRWAKTTRDFLARNQAYNVVMWSWCGGVSGNSQTGINTYLRTMQKLEKAFPHVIFIYMTGHLDGSGPAGNRTNGMPNLRKANAQIRAFCKKHNKVLFDFEDIESWDPNGKYYPNETDKCGWCKRWCASNPCPPCDQCAHSHCFNCFQKGKAFWWMMARLAGWNGHE
jgi:hypothetical protein